MGANVFSDWKVGSTITYTGEFQGKKYQDKGVIQKVEPEKILQSTFFSPLSGKEDTPDNYYLVTYILSKSDGKTMVTLLQDNISTEKERVHSIENWKSVLRKLKAVVESETA